MFAPRAAVVDASRAGQVGIFTIIKSVKFIKKYLHYFIISRVFLDALYHKINIGVQVWRP